MFFALALALSCARTTPQALPTAETPVEQQSAPSALPPPPEGHPWFRGVEPEPAIAAQHVLGDGLFQDPEARRPNTLALSPDTTVIASGSEYGLLRLFDARTGELLANLESEDTWISNVVFAGPRRLITNAEGGLLRIWDLDVDRAEDIRSTALPLRHQISAEDLAVHGNLLVSADRWANVIVWDLEKREVVTVLSEREDTGDGVVLSEADGIRCAFSPDGEHLAIHYGGFAFEVLETENWTRVATAKWKGGRQNAAFDLAFSGDDTVTVLHLRSWGQLVVTDWSLDEVSVRRQRRALGPVEVEVPMALSEDGRYVAVVDWGLRVWDLAGSKELDLEGLGPMSTERLAFSGDTLAVGGGGETLRTVGLDPIWASPTRPNHNWFCAALSAKGVAALSGRGRVDFWRPGEPLKSFALPAEVLRFDTTGDLLAGQGEEVWLLDMEREEVVLEHLRRLGYVMATSMDLSADGTRLAYGGYAGDLFVVDTTSGEVEGPDNKHGLPSDLHFSPDGTRIASVGASNDLLIRDEHGDELASLDLDISEVAGWSGDQIAVLALRRLETPDDSYAADQLLMLVDPTSGDQTVLSKTAEWSRSSLTRDGRYFAWSDERGGLTVRDQSSDLEVRIEERGVPVSATSFDPDGSHLLVLRSDERVLLYRTEDLFSGVLGDPPDSVEAVVSPANLYGWSPSGAAVSIGGNAVLQPASLDEKPAKRAGTLGTPLRERVDVYASPDGETALHSGWEELRAVRVSDGKELWSLPQVEDTSVLVFFSADGALALTLGDNRGAQLFSVSKGELVAGWFEEIPDARHTFAAFSPDSRRAAVLSTAGVLRIIDVQSGEVQRSLEGMAAAESLVFSEDAETLAGFGAGTLRIWDLQSGRVRFVESSDWIGGTFSADLSLAWMVGYAGFIEEIELKRGGTRRTWTLPGRPDLHHVSHALGRRLAVSTYDVTYIVDLDTESTTHALEGGGPMSVSADGELLMVDSASRWTAWSLPDLVPIRRKAEHLAAIDAIALDEKRVVTGDDEGTILVRQRSDGSVLHHLFGLVWRVADLALGPVGSPVDGHLLVAGKNGECLLVELATSKVVQRFSVSDDYDVSVAFSPDGASFLISSWDDSCGSCGHLEIWDSKTLKRRAWLKDVSYDTFDFDTGRVLASGHESPISVIDLASGEVLREVVLDGDGGEVTNVAGLRYDHIAVATIRYEGYWPLPPTKLGSPGNMESLETQTCGLGILTPDARRWVAFSCEEPHDLVVLDASTGEELARLESRPDDDVWSMVADESQIYLGWSSGVLTVQDLPKSP